METDLILEMTLQARELLMTETRQQFESVYGLKPDGSFEDAAQLPAIGALKEVRETRDRLEKFLADEASAGLKGEEAVDIMVKEAAFTHLNRLVAFKMLEARKLVRGMIDRYHDSNAFKLYLAEDAHNEDLTRYEAGTMPQNLFGEGPRDLAYRNFLLWQTARMAKEIKVLFDPDNLASRLFPRPRALKRLIEMLNQSTLKDAWLPDNEETIGWVYQSFNSKELEAAFREARLSKKKFEAADIPAVTQLFTPRWIVRFLVENTLGRLWLEMHPDSSLEQKLAYLVGPPSEHVLESMRPVSTIQLLDPACGTMHFGLVAFDLFVEMYREELAQAGKPGWPEKASVASEDDIPSAIIRNNIYGIDIDLRAVQLSALTLFLKAKTLNPKAQLEESRLACADIHMLDGQRLNDFLAMVGLERPIYNRILSALQDRLSDSDQLGSLLRLDEEIRALVERERQRYDREGRSPDLFGWSTEQFETEAGRQEFWEILEVQITQALDLFARQQTAEGKDQSFFVGETTKGLRLLEVMGNRYDVVVTNPPYMSNRKMNDRLKKLVVDSFPAGKRDLYAAFIQRCLELTRGEGRVGMLTMHSFMFISSYESLRNLITERAALETMVHTGPALFAVGNPGTLQTAAYILRADTDQDRRNETVGTYFRLVKEPSGEAKQQRFEQALSNIRACWDAPTVYRYRQGDFKSIPGSPWVYWISLNLRLLFSSLPKLRDFAPPRVGLQTGDNFRFLRYWWEVGKKRIGFGLADPKEARASCKRWFPYMKGGGFRRWYGNQEFIVNWQNDGAEIRHVGLELGKIASRPQNTDYYFCRGVTWTDLTSGRFSARLSPGGFIFDVSGSCVFPVDELSVLGIMVSNFSQFALKLINPTLHVQVGDLGRLPIPEFTTDALKKLAAEAIDLVKQDCKADEVTFDFVEPIFDGCLERTVQLLQQREERLSSIECETDEQVYRLYGITQEDRKAIEGELSTPLIVDDQESGEAEDSKVSEEEPSEARMENQVGLAKRWVSYAVGVMLGRFQPGIEGALGRGEFSTAISEKLRALSDRNAVATFDEAHADDLARKVEAALELMLGEEGAAQVLYVALSNSSGDGETLTPFRRYLERDFFTQHVQQYRKRPVYWLLQSPKRHHSLLLFHEGLTADSLPLIRGTRYLGGKINQLSEQIKEIRSAAASVEGGKKKVLERQLELLETQLNDVQNFDQAVGRVIDMRNDRGEAAGWVPEIDDGVMLNMAPLYELLPSWKAEPKKYWDSLKAGKYDWSATAMRYWPNRVLAKCKTNKSYAIAHKREDLYEAD